MKTQTTAPQLNPETAETGMAVTYHLWSDSVVYHITDVQQNGKRLVLREAKATLLNGANSGEPDALSFSPGGFVGHTSGRQRWEIEADPNGREMIVTWRRAMRRQDGHGGVIEGGYKKTGWATKSPGGSISLGAFPHHDYNF